MPAGFAEHLSILHAVAVDVTERFYKHRQALALADFSNIFVGEKIQKRLVDKFPTLDTVLKEKDPGYDTFVTNAAGVIARLEPFVAVFSEVREFREHALTLLTEMSSPKNVLSFSLDVNELAFAGYYDLMLQYAKLHILVGGLASPAGRGKLALAAYAKAYAVLNHGRAPADYEALAKYLLDYEKPVPRLQDDFTRARLRVADTLLPLGMQILRLCDTGTLRNETLLSPLPAAAPPPKRGNPDGPAAPPAAVEPLLARLPEAKQWLIYGLLLYPDDLAEAGAIDLLMALLGATYVLPVYGTDVLHPHTAFEADSKTLYGWIKKKDEAKRFASLLKESKVTAYRQAGLVHATTRNVLITKLSHLHSALLDNPSLAAPRFFAVLHATLKLASDEVTWWAIHADAIPDDLPRKERDAERDLASYHPASVEALLRLSALLVRRVSRERALLTEAAASRMLAHAEAIAELTRAAKQQVALPSDVAALLHDLPKHAQHAAKVGCDLRGLRLNILRLVCEFSQPQLAAQVGGYKCLAKLLAELHACAQTSLAVDASEQTLRDASAPTSLVAAPAKLERVFACALDAKPTDCLVLLEIAARATAVTAAAGVAGGVAGGVGVASPLPSMMERLGQRVHALLRELADHFRNQRTNPHGVASILEVIQKGCTLCHALDAAPPLVYTPAHGGPPVSLSLQAWLRENIEAFVESHLRWIVFPAPNSAEPRLPTTSLALLADLSHALATLEPYINLDAHAMLDAVVVRELGAIETVGPNPTPEPPPANAEAGSAAAVRAEGPIIDEAAAEHARALAAPGDDHGGDGRSGGNGSGTTPTTLIHRLRLWLKRLAERALQPDGPQYVAGRRAFGRTALDAVQMSALCRLVGTCGMSQLEQVLLDVASATPGAIGGVLHKNREALQVLSSSFERTRQLDGAVSGQLIELNVLLASCRALGIALVARSLCLAGVADAKAGLTPPAVPSFVAGLGAQQLPDGSKAGMVLPAVTSLLGAFGQLGAADVDAPVARLLTERAGVEASDREAWASLPYALALMLTLPEWAQVSPLLAEDGISGNVHCLAHALHALLCLAEAHVPNVHYELPSEVAAQQAGRFAHRRFLEVASLVLLKQRQQLLAGHVKPAELPVRERCLASQALLLEQLVTLAQPLGYGDLQAFVPYTLLLSSYTAIAQPNTLAGDASRAAVGGGGLHTTGVDVSDSARSGRGSAVVGVASARGSMVSGDL